MRIFKKTIISILITTLIITAFCTLGASAKIIRVLHVASLEADHLAENVKKFTEMTGINVIVDIVAREISDQRLMRALIEQKGDYDIVMSASGPDYKTYVNKGAYIPIEDYLTKEEVEQFYGRGNFTDPRTGKMAGIPQYHNFQMLFYRKDLLNDPKEKAAFKEKYGRELTVPKTLQELYEVAEFFHRPPEMYGYFVSGLEWAWRGEYAYFLFGEGENYGDEEGNLTLNGPGAIKAMEYMVKLTKFAPLGWEAMSFYDGDTLMKEGKLFMYQNWTYVWDTLCQEMPDKVDIAVPVGDVDPGVGLSGWLALIPKNAPNLEEAVKFVKWIGSYDYQKSIMMDLPGNLSSRKDVVADPDIRKTWKGIEKFEKALLYTHVPQITWRAEVCSGQYEVFFKVLKGQMTASEGLNWLQNVKFAGRRAIE